MVNLAFYVDYCRVCSISSFVELECSFYLGFKWILTNLEKTHGKFEK